VEAGGRVLELVVYKLNDGVSREQFLGTNGAVSSWISKQPGFISRDLVHDAEGNRWVDVVSVGDDGARRRGRRVVDDVGVVRAGRPRKGRARVRSRARRGASAPTRSQFESLRPHLDDSFALVEAKWKRRQSR